MSSCRRSSARCRWPEYVAIARAAEEVGFDSIWLGDHLLYRDDGREERGPWDAWTLLGALAAVTDRVRLGPLVACAGFASAGLLARKAAAVQEISGGRLVLGLGAGWNETEFRAFGVPFDHRASRFVESFDIIRRLLAGERVTFDGAFERLDDAVLLPRPAVPVPLMVGSTGERVLRAALPHVDAWNIWFDWYGNTPEGFAAENDRVSRLVGEPAVSRPRSPARPPCSSPSGTAGETDRTPPTCRRSPGRRTDRPRAGRVRRRRASRKRSSSSARSPSTRSARSATPSPRSDPEGCRDEGLTRRRHQRSATTRRHAGHVAGRPAEQGALHAVDDPADRDTCPTTAQETSRRRRDDGRRPHLRQPRGVGRRW